MQNDYCIGCIHFEKDYKCKAFPKGIPDVILNGKNDHTKPLPEQDNSIIFEKRDN